MLKELEKLFGFRTSETTHVPSYLERMDVMGKLDSRKQHQLTALFIEKIMKIEERLDSLEAQKVTELVSEPVEPLITKQELTTMKADITRLKKKVYPTK